MPGKPYTGRDALLVALIRGTTKAGAHADRRREASRRACKRPVRQWLAGGRAGENALACR